MTLEMRELRGDDLFPVLAIVGKLDVKDEIIEVFSKDDAVIQLADHKDKKKTKKEQAEFEEKVKGRGVAMMAGILQKVLVNLNKVKPEVNAFLADLCGVPVKQIQGLGLTEYTGLIKDFVKKEELKDFLSSIANLMQ